MKFLNRINKQYLITLIFVLILISVLGYFVLHAIIINETQEDIFEKEYAIIQEIKSRNNLPNLYPVIKTKRISENKVEPKSFKEIYLIDKAEEDEEEPFLEYTNSVKINNQWYLIKIRHSLVETDALILAIALPLLLLLLLAFLFTFFLTRKQNKTLWMDFEKNLQQIKGFSFTGNQEITLKNTGISEFDLLNDTIRKMTVKLRADYLSLKEFTENASHELQTPLSVISLNLEELLQQDLPESQLEKVHSALQSVKRLSNLNKSLLLLSKLENRQFKDEKEINLSSVVIEKLQDFQPIIESKNIKINNINTCDFTIPMNSDLSEILIGNLLINAITHNNPDGMITVKCQPDIITFCNTGTEKPLDNSRIFNRFTKFNSQSFGLGLAIIKQICNLYNLQIRYNYDDGLHCFSITKRK